jgi:hypothetical protein
MPAWTETFPPGSLAGADLIGLECSGLADGLLNDYCL